MKLGTTSWLTGENFLDNARLVEGRVDFVELLVYTWDRPMRAKVGSWLDGLAALDLEYTVHLPTDKVAGALAVAQFFAESGFPLLNMTLHPLPGWREVDWPELVAMENLIDQVEFHPRFTFDLTHSLLGKPLPSHFHPHIVDSTFPAPTARPITCRLMNTHCSRRCPSSMRKCWSVSKSLTWQTP
ncbi:hypothetical protein [uncultured Desulfobulbus sp.]|uniref:hypothetical protein n=1 Tax=uncultured Desulfobulbus sp. TaxID=239745 RepID=UPI0029C67719|nr:hypothetical protein [uncultured Desulfobulbus sp.]